jgi:hypothetical protein
VRGDVASGVTPTVLIHLGSPPPAYLRICAAQLVAVTGRQPTVVGPGQGAGFRGRKLNLFRKHESLSGMGLNRFWRYACERIFVLEELMRAVGLDRCLHVESDVLMYLPPDGLMPWLSDAYGSAVAICPLTAIEDTAAVMYVGSLRSLSRLTKALLELVKMGPSLLDVHGGDMAHEMRMLHILRTEHGLCEALPTTIARAMAMASPCVFDAASYGQHVDGTVSEPGVRYTADHHEIGRELISGRCELVWDAHSHRPFVRGETGEHNPWPLANLHIHSKRLARWAIIGTAHEMESRQGSRSTGPASP